MNAMKCSCHDLYQLSNIITCEYTILPGLLYQSSIIQFKIILFKLFILPIIDYCSVLFITTNKINYQKLSKAFTKSAKSLLKIDLRNQMLSSQSKLLEPFNISFLILRIFSHYCTFTFNIFTRNKVPSISRYFHESQHVMSLRNQYSITK